MNKKNIFGLLFFVGCASSTNISKTNLDDVACDQLAQSVGQSPIVALGETHGTNEFSAFKANCVKKLIMENNFNVIAIEADFVGVSWLNDYIQTGEGDPKALLDYINYNFNTLEFLNLVNWLRDYRSTSHRSISLVGIDFQDRFRIKIELKNFFRKWAPDYVSTLDRSSGKDDSKKIIELQKTNPKLGKNGSYSYYLKIADLLVQNDQLKQKHEQSMRDRYMAQNLNWHIEQQKDAPKTIFWAHNFHISHDNDNFHSTTFFLEQELNKPVVAVGLFYGSGTYLASTFKEPTHFKIWSSQAPTSSSLEYLLGRLYQQVVFVEFHGNNLIGTATSERFIGWVKEANEFSASTPSKKYDSVVFFPRSSPLLLLNH